MKKSIFIAALILIYSGKLISQEYHEKFKSDICSCFEDKFYKLKRASSAFDKCYKETLPSYAGLIDAQINEDDTNLKFRKGQQLRKELGQRYQIELIYSCDLYYRAKEEEYRKKMAKGITEVSFADLKSLNEMVAMYPKAVSYMFRAKTHFYLGNLEQAESDIKESYNVDTGSLNSLERKQQKALYALILQEQGRYAEAGKLYGEIYETTKDMEAAIFQAMVNKLSGGGYKDSNYLGVTKSQSKNSKKDTSDKKTKEGEGSDLRKLFKLKENR